MCDHTARMMEEVERELCVTRACRHPHVVQVIGLMVGPGRIAEMHIFSGSSPFFAGILWVQSRGGTA